MDNKSVANWMIYLYTFSFLLVLCFLIMFYRGTVYDNRNLVWASLAILGFSFCIVAFLVMKHALTSIETTPTFEEMVKNHLDEYFVQVNKQHVERGLWWRAVPGHYWVELRIDPTLKQDVQKMLEIQKLGSIYFA